MNWILLLVMIITPGCVSTDFQREWESGRNAGYVSALKEIKYCARVQVDLYQDLCAESRNDDLPSMENHFEGVRCAADGVLYCMDIQR